MSYSLTQQDAIKYLISKKDNSVDLFLLDPPYQSLEKHRNIGTTTRLQDWFDIFPNDRLPQLLSEMYRVLRNNRHAYIMCDEETADIIKPIARSVGFKFWKSIIWDKVSIGMGYHYRAQYEVVLFLEKGKRPLADLSVGDVISVERVKSKRYPTEKPVRLLSILIFQSTLSGETVCDPFFGSGSTAVAALSLDRNFDGADNSERAIMLATERLKRFT